jgi:hypothetical protein
VLGHVFVCVCEKRGRLGIDRERERIIETFVSDDMTH